ncbi:hypothetical protein AGMMS50268_27660 [Spirochaetia bacterium]|nr:hypothetical protein AGMMS50268_27660 [Spirochaetia bacterium]
MAESTELSTFVITGGIPSNPIEVKDFIKQLETGINLARAALKQKGIEFSKYQEILEKGQEWAALKLKAELQLKDYIEKIPKNAGGKTKKRKMAPNGRFASKKNKMTVIKDELELTVKQYREIKKLTPDGVQKAIDEADKIREIPTRYSALIWTNRLNKENEPGEKKKIKPKLPEKDNMKIEISTTYGDSKKLVFEYDSKMELDWFFKKISSDIYSHYGEYQFVKPPFNYPGGKTKILHDIIVSILVWSEGHEPIVSPFLGAGALEVNLAHRGHEVIGYDFDPDIANLWIQLLENNEKLKKKIHYFIDKRIETEDPINYKKTYTGIWKDYFDESGEEPIYKNDVFKDGLDRAAIYWLLIMTSFNSRVRSKSVGGQYFDTTKHNFVDERIVKYTNICSIEWTEDKPDDVKFKGPSLTMGGCLSFEESIRKHPDNFLYCDPPYLLKKANSNLYKKHETFDHELLADTLKKRNNWILSYNACDEIRELYKEFKIEELNCPYPMTNRSGEKQKIGKELLIYGPMTVVE